MKNLLKYTSIFIFLFLLFGCATNDIDRTEDIHILIDPEIEFSPSGLYRLEAISLSYFLYPNYTLRIMINTNPKSNNGSLNNTQLKVHYRLNVENEMILEQNNVETFEAMYWGKDIFDEDDNALYNKTFEYKNFEDNKGFYTSRTKAPFVSVLSAETFLGFRIIVKGFIEVYHINEEGDRLVHARSDINEIFDLRI